MPAFPPTPDSWPCSWLTAHPQGRSLSYMVVWSQKLLFQTANLGKFISISIYQLVSSNPQYGQFFTIVHSHRFLFALSFPLLFRHACTLSHLGNTWHCRVCCVSFPMSFPVHICFFLLDDRLLPSYLKH